MAWADHLVTMDTRPCMVTAVEGKLKQHLGIEGMHTDLLCLVAEEVVIIHPTK